MYDPASTNDCQDSTIATKGSSGCGSTVRATSLLPTKKGTVADATITTKNNNKYTLTSAFDLKVKVAWHGTGKTSFDGSLRSTINVRSSVDCWPQCYAQLSLA